MQMSKTYLMITVLNGDITKAFYLLMNELPTHIKFAGIKDNDLFFFIPDGKQCFAVKQLNQIMSTVALVDINIGDIYANGDVIMRDLVY